MKTIYSLAIAVSIFGAVAGYIYACQEAAECEGVCEVSVTPSVSPSITETPTPTPECTLVLKGEFMVCDEVTPTVTQTPSPTPPTCQGEEHLDASGMKCVRFSEAGAPTSSWTPEDYNKNFPGEGKFHGVAK